MASWVKSSLILVIALAIVLIIASAQDWPVTLWLTGSIIGFLAMFSGYSDNSRITKRESAFFFLFLSVVILLVSFVIYQTATYGFKATLIGVLTGDGESATGSELITFWSLIVEISLCVLMIRYIPGYLAADSKRLHGSRVCTR